MSKLPRLSSSAKAQTRREAIIDAMHQHHPKQLTTQEIADLAGAPYASCYNDLRAMSQSYKAPEPTDPVIWNGWGKGDSGNRTTWALNPDFWGDQQVKVKRRPPAPGEAVVIHDFFSEHPYFHRSWTEGTLCDQDNRIGRCTTCGGGYVPLDLALRIGRPCARCWPPEDTWPADVHTQEYAEQIIRRSLQAVG